MAAHNEAPTGEALPGRPRSTILLAALSILAACDTDSAAPERDGSASAERSEKVDVCHLNGSGNINVLSVSSSAVSSHLAHGDHLAGTYFLDADGDGVGDSAETAECLYDDYVTDGGDCDDDDAATSPEAEEVCGDEIDNNCDGEVDEGCTVEVEINVAGDNGVWVWVNGEAIALDGTYPDWSIARSATLELPTGEDHAFAFYIEDWGGLAYFAASIRVDGDVVAATGDGDFVSTGGVSASYVNEWPRIAAWADVPESSGDWPNLLFSPGSTWGDWMEVGFNDSSWDSDSGTACSAPYYWNTSHFNTYYTDFGDLYDDGAAFVWHDFGTWSPGVCYSSGDSAAAYRVELSL